MPDGWEGCPRCPSAPNSVKAARRRRIVHFAHGEGGPTLGADAALRR